jgi:hypothetical protein
MRRNTDVAAGYTSEYAFLFGRRFNFFIELDGIIPKVQFLGNQVVFTVGRY